MNDQMTMLAADLVSTVTSAAGDLRSRKEPEVSIPPALGKWSPKQILGHLIDSAANNHQRFVRLQMDGEFADSGYEQDRWVQVQDYQSTNWLELIELWVLYNRHVAHVVSRIPEDKLDATLSIGGSDPVTLHFIAKDYVQHLKHHLRQLGLLQSTG